MDKPCSERIQQLSHGVRQLPRRTEDVHVLQAMSSQDMVVHVRGYTASAKGSLDETSYGKLPARNTPRFARRLQQVRRTHDPATTTVFVPESCLHCPDVVPRCE
jgi:hypothetical protein